MGETLLRVADNADGFITKDEINRIFSTLEGIQDANGKLLKLLVQRMSTWNCTSLIGDIFLQQVHLYLKFENNLLCYV